MIRAMQELGYEPRLLGQFATEEQLQQLVLYEESLPEGTPLMFALKFETFAPWDAVYQLEEELAKTDLGKVFEYYVYRDADDPTTVYITYTKGIALSSILIGILLIVGLPLLLGGLVWVFLPEAMKQMINIVIMVVVMMFMFKIMGSALKEPKKPETLLPPAYPYPPPAPRPPVEQRIADRVESIANSIARIEAAFRRSEHEGASKVTRVASDIGSVAREVHRVPEAEMPRERKAQVYDRLSGKQRRLFEQYEERLTPRQRQLLEDERKIVEDLRTMYD